MGFIRYVSIGRKAPAMTIDVSMNGGNAWLTKKLLPGQSFPIPPLCTNLVIDGIPYDPKGNYEIRNGHVIVK